jgi:tetraacyldisaccharide 4'-kinase
VPVLVVGALQLGGAGRTPVAAWLARRASDRGARVALVGHGHRAATSGRVDAPDGARFGDEAAMLRRSLPREVAVWAGHERLPEAAVGVDLVVVDDGWFSRRVPRTGVVAVVDATVSLDAAGAGVFPAGPLRAGRAALEDVDLVWVQKVDEPDARTDGWPEGVRSRWVLTGVRGPGGTCHPPVWLRGRPVVLAVGVGRPESVLHHLRAAGADVVEVLRSPDHRTVDTATLARRSAAGATLVTTAKDAERWPGRVPVHVVEADLCVESGQPAVDALLERLITGAGGPGGAGGQVG